MPDLFSYTRYRVNDDRRTVRFMYRVQHDGQTYDFTEVLVFPSALKDTLAQAASLRALHLALGVSYYKIFVPPLVEYPYAMDKAEAVFWNDVWRHGLGEFLYVNRLSPERLAVFQAQEGDIYEIGTEEPTERALLGIGGGKDSIVAGEALKQLDIPTEGFVMATGKARGQAQAVADIMGIPLHAVERTLDPLLLAAQQQPGAYHGHIPISMIFGLVGTALAIALDARYVVVANEASASIPRITWEHGAVNHQWSKSFTFERALQQYLRTMVAPVVYTSIIRPLTCVTVAKLFARYPQYFEVFTSDNSVFRIDASKRPAVRWSLESPKSLSSFILLAPWMSERDLLRAFGRNYLDEASLATLFLELTGQEGEPPLDCVGTPEELVLSLNLIEQQCKFAASCLMQLARNKAMVEQSDIAAKLAAATALQGEYSMPGLLAARVIEYFTKKLA